MKPKLKAQQQAETDEVLARANHAEHQAKLDAETPEQTLERFGVEKVRVMLQSGTMPQYLVAAATHWLADHEKPSITVKQSVRRAPRS